jgi:integrase
MGDKIRIGIRQIEALRPGETIWDSAVIGFGARRQRSEAVTYHLFYRTAEGRRQRWHTIGRHGAPWTPDEARKEARRVLGRVAAGSDPGADKQTRRKAQTVAELCDAYLADAEAGRIITRFGTSKRMTTLAVDRGRIARHIKPTIGKLAVASVTSDDIDKLMKDIACGRTAATIKTGPRGLARVRGGQGAANRVVRLLQGIFTYAGRRADNPAHRITMYKDGTRDYRLSDGDYSKLGAALAKADPHIWPAATAVIRFLALTGWRSGEALALRWDEVDLARRTAFLPDTKTGKSARPLSIAACDVLRALPYQKAPDSMVFPATRGDGLMAGFKKLFRDIVKAGGLSPAVTPHVLRHSFASVAADLGFSDLTIAALIGHKGRSMTSRYAHGADTVLLAAADAVANRIMELMGKKATARTAKTTQRKRIAERAANKASAPPIITGRIII